MKRPTLEPTESMRKALRRAELDVARGIDLDPEGDSDSELEGHLALYSAAARAHLQ